MRIAVVCALVVALVTVSGDVYAKSKKWQKLRHR